MLRPPPPCGTALTISEQPASPVPAPTTPGKTVVSVPLIPLVPPSQNFKASSCSILSCEYSAVRAARCPCVSVVETATAARPITPAATISNIARAIIVSITVSPACGFRLRDKIILRWNFICFSLQPIPICCTYWGSPALNRPGGGDGDALHDCSVGQVNGARGYRTAGGVDRNAARIEDDAGRTPNGSGASVDGLASGLCWDGWLLSRRRPGSQASGSKDVALRKVENWAGADHRAGVCYVAVCLPTSRATIPCLVPDFQVIRISREIHISPGVRKAGGGAHLGQRRQAVDGAKITCDAQISRGSDILRYGNRGNGYGHHYNDQHLHRREASLSFLLHCFPHAFRHKIRQPEVQARGQAAT